MSLLAPKCDVLVIGGGIAGACAALACAEQGLRTHVVDAATPTATTTWASGGMLAPKAEGLEGELLRQGEAALAAYPAYLRGLLSRADAPPLHAGRGMAVAFFADDPVDWWVRYAAARAAEGLAVRLIEPEDWPGPPPAERLVGGMVVDDEGWVEPRQLLLALHAALARMGTAVQWAMPITHLSPDGEGMIALSPGGAIRANHVIVATGAAPAVPGIDWPGDGRVYGDRGLMIRIHGVVPPTTVVYHHGPDATTYLVPDPYGVRVGSTSTPHDRRPTPAPGEIAALLGRARRLWPGLDAGTVAEVGVGFRPVGPDSAQPWTGPLDERGRVWGLLGLHRNGILLAPRLAQELVQSAFAAA